MTMASRKMYKFVCAHCDKVFRRSSRYGSPKYCSQNCYWNSGHGTNKCKNCDKTFSGHKYYVKDRQFCSKKCDIEYKLKNQLLVVCEWCGKEKYFMKSMASNRRFCTQKCFAEYMKRNRQLCKCKHCGKKIMVAPCNVERKSYCSKKCANDHRRTSKPHDMLSPERTKWYKLIYERDNWTCQMCGARSRKLNAHHIYPIRDLPELMLYLDNGICLCWNCHCYKVNTHEYDYLELFLTNLSDRNIDDKYRGIVSCRT